MTRTRINIDVDSSLHDRLRQMADITGTTPTEIARALIEMHAYGHVEYHTLGKYARARREVSNQRRSLTQTFRRQTQQESTREHPLWKPRQPDSEAAK